MKTTSNKTYFLLEKNNRGNTAGTKLKDDIMDFFFLKGFSPLSKVPLYSSNKKDFLYIIKSIFSIICLCLKLSIIKNKTIYMLYPLIKINLWNKFFLRACKRNKVILFMFDIRYFQYKCFNIHEDFTIEKEVEFLNNSYACVVQTDLEGELLKKKGLSSKIYNLKFLDYKSKVYCLNTNERVCNSVAFAGYLPRATFLKKISSAITENIQFYIFGNDRNIEKNSNLKYCGDVNSNLLIEKISRYKYGLVWDGDDIDTFGNFYCGYEKYIIPHKAASYINSGLPLVVWAGSALANFVDEYQIGVKINSIEDLPKILEGITEDMYLQMVEHVKIMQNMTSNFYFLNKVIDSISL